MEPKEAHPMRSQEAPRQETRRDKVMTQRPKTRRHSSKQARHPSMRHQTASGTDCEMNNPVSLKEVRVVHSKEGRPCRLGPKTARSKEAMSKKNTTHAPAAIVRVFWGLGVLF